MIPKPIPAVPSLVNQNGGRPQIGTLFHASCNEAAKKKYKITKTAKLCLNRSLFATCGKSCRACLFKGGAVSSETVNDCKEGSPQPDGENRKGLDGPSLDKWIENAYYALQAQTVKRMTNSGIFDNNISVKLQRKLLALVFESCKTASEHCFGSFSSHRVAKDVSGVYRRGRIEDQWEGIPALFKGEVSVETRFYRNYTGSYCELTCGVVKLTQSCVIERGDIPREAEFRETLATNGQRELFKEDVEDGDKPKFLYSILTYGIDQKAKNRDVPAFIKIEFPNSKCTAPVDDGINLVGRYPDISMKYLTKPSFEAAVTERDTRRGRKRA